MEKYLTKNCLLVVDPYKLLFKLEKNFYLTFY